MTTVLQEEARISSGLSKILGRQYNAVLGRMVARITLAANARRDIDKHMHMIA